LLQHIRKIGRGAILPELLALENPFPTNKDNYTVVRDKSVTVDTGS